MTHPIRQIIMNHKSGRHAGIYSCCSANEYVLRAVMQRAIKHRMPVLIEATANQVNQFGGYTGLTPSDFYKWCRELAAMEGFDENGLILGGDHLGPLTWAGLCEEEAMANAEELVSQYVLAGFTKIHIDTSMRLATDDQSGRLPDEVIAGRGARLCLAAERAYERLLESRPEAVKPVYVIGSEVPIPGGIQEAEALAVTRPDDCRATISAFREAFDREGLTSAWERVVAVVVQPGVEFGENEIFIYERGNAAELCGTLKDEQGIVFEGHSTDYQPKTKLREMVSDGIIILKVGPALTFALREALFALEQIEKVILRGRGICLSGFADALETAMLENPVYWQKHYHGDGFSQRVSRAYSFSDRARYYLPVPSVTEAVTRLTENLGGKPIPLPMLSQYMPMQYTRVNEGLLANDVDSLILDRIGDCIDDYIYALNE